MIRHVFKYEYKKGMADKTLPFTSSAIVLLVFIAVGTGSRWVKFQENTIAQLQNAEKEQLETIVQDVAAYEAKYDTNEIIETQTPMHPVTMYASKRGYTWKAPNPMSIYCIGQSDIYPYYHLFMGIDDQLLPSEEEIQNPQNLLIGKMDLTFVIVYLLPIIVIAFTFNFISGEREAGTIRIVQTQNISLLRYVGYKLSFRFLTVFCTFILATFVATAIWYPALFATVSWIKLTVFIGFTLFYLCFWMFLAFLINTFGKSSEVNGLILIGCWIFWSFIIPSVAGTIAEKKFPIPSRNLQIIEERNELNALSREEALQAYLASYPELKRSPDAQSQIKEIDWYPGFLAAQYNAYQTDTAYENNVGAQLLLQQRYIQHIANASPSMLFKNILEGLSENSLTDYIYYKRDVRGFILKWRKYLGSYVFLGKKLTGTDFVDLPKFVGHQKQIPIITWINYAILFLITGGTFLFWGIFKMNRTKYGYRASSKKRLKYEQ